MKISASSMNTFLKCKRAFYYYKTEKFAKSLNFSFGLAMEYGLECFVNGKSIEDSIKLTVRKFIGSKVEKDYIYNILFDELIKKYSQNDYYDIAYQINIKVDESIDLLKEVTERLINFVIKEELKFAGMQLTTIIDMKNGNLNEVRLDGIVIKDNKKYIFELKSYSKYKSYKELKHDNQLLNYMNVLTRKGEENLEGVLFVQVKKIKVEEPKVLKKGGLSKDKTQKCDPQVYYDMAVDIYGENDIPQDILDCYIELYNKREFIEMIEVKFTQEELDEHWKLTNFISKEMDEIDKAIKDSDKDILYKCYPSYGMGCSMCNYKEKCWKENIEEEIE